jgi:dephospho-CoA kinase
MVILGLTGSIAMGKTAAARAFCQLGVRVHDADKVVHALMGPNGLAVEKVQAEFSGVVQDGGVDRVALGRRVFSNLKALRKLEGILHPLVRDAERRFLSTAVRRGDSVVVLDIPLLFETSSDDRCDFIVVVSAPARIQKSRVLARPGMTADRFSQVLTWQMSDAKKKEKADFIVPTGIGKAHSLRVIKSITKFAKYARGGKWGPGHGC